MNALKKSIALFVALLLLTNVWVPSNSYAAAGGGDYYISTVAGNGDVFITGGNNVDAKITHLKFPLDVALDSDGNLYIVELGHHRIRKVDAATGLIRTVAGTVTAGDTPVDGTQLATSVQLYNPQSIVVDSGGNLYIGDGKRVLKVDTDGRTSQLWTGAVRDLALDRNGQLYIVQSYLQGDYKGRVLKYNNDGSTCLVAGVGVSGTLTACVTSSPAISEDMGAQGIAFDDEDNLYIADSVYHRILKVDSSGNITTVAGQYNVSGFDGDGGLAEDALLNTPYKIVLDNSGTLYFTDRGNHAIRKVDLATKVISTVAGNGEGRYSGDNGLASMAQLNSPIGIAQHSDGTIYVVDGSSNRVRALKKGYGVTYDGNASTTGSEPAATVVDLNAVISVPDEGNLVRQGYTFNGWNSQADGGGTNYPAGSPYTVTGNVTLYAQWQIKEYTLNYTAGPNGTIDGQSSVTQTVYHDLSGAAVTAIPNTGYVFEKWSDNNNTNAIRTDSNVTGSIAAQATFKEAIFDVSFESNGAGTIPSQTIAYNGTVTEPADIVRTGYTFHGWYSDVSLTTPFVFTTPITADTVLYAKWTINLSYTAGLNGTIDGQPSVTQSVYHGADGITVTAIPNTGYLFEKWSDNNNTNAIRTDTNITGPIVAQATFVQAENIVSFESNGGGTIPSQTIAYSGTVTKPADPSRTDYTFDGWYSDAALTTPFVFTTPITADTVLYAKWTINLIYTAGLNGTIDGQPSVTQSVYHGLSSTAVTAIPNTGYVFEKWSDNNTDITRTDVNVQSPISVTANFVKEVYTLSFTSNGGSAVPSQNVPYNEYANAPTSFPTLDGYSFAGWYGDSDLNNSFNFVNTPITENTTLYAKWIIVPPGAPVIQSAVAGDSNISITWSSVDTATQYHVFQSTTSGSYGLTPTISVSDSVYSYQATGLTNGTTYYFVVSAVNAGGDGVASIEVSATPKTVPQAPTNVTATAGNGSASIHFTPPTDNGGSPITGYKIIWTSDSLTVTETSTPITVTGLTNGTAYTFTVQAINSVGNSVDSAASNEVTPVAPTNDDGDGSGGSDSTVEEGTTGEENGSTVEEGTTGEENGSTVEEGTGTTGTVPHTDITGHWAEVSIRQAVEQRIVSGYPDGTFKPNATINRAEFITMLMNALKPVGKGAELNFTDMDTIGAWARQAIEQSVEAGILSGYSDGSFRPSAKITRAELAVMIARALGVDLTALVDSTGFADDSQIPAWAKAAVAAVKELGIVSGRNGNLFAAGDTATRAEAITVIMLLLQQN